MQKMHVFNLFSPKQEDVAQKLSTLAAELSKIPIVKSGQAYPVDVNSTPAAALFTHVATTGELAGRPVVHFGRSSYPGNTSFTVFDDACMVVVRTATPNLATVAVIAPSAQVSAVVKAALLSNVESYDNAQQTYKLAGGNGSMVKIFATSGEDEALAAQYAPPPPPAPKIDIRKEIDRVMVTVPPAKKLFNDMLDVIGEKLGVKF